MKKYLMIAATAALALASCTSDDAIEQAQKPVDDGAVTFGAYTGRTARAELVDQTYKLANAGGFGVFAYEQGSADFSSYSANNSYPNFFYNQQVWENTFNATTNHKPDGTTAALTAAPSDGFKWLYSPIKYYSNNEGAKHSFFAYAPYNASVNNVFKMGSAPAIRYNANVDDYDLMWAAQPNMLKQALTSTIDFNFAHALSQVNIYVAPFVDEVHNDTHTGTYDDGVNSLNENTKIKVRSVKFVGTVASQGLLNLADGSWTIEATDEAVYEINTPVTLDHTNYTGDNKYAEVKTEMMVIPSKNLQIQIVYDVVTTDPNNPANSSTITNTIVSKVENGFNLVQGTAYNFLLDLGMKTVQFNAETTSWGDHNGINVDLPNNYKFELISSVRGTAAPTSVTVHEVTSIPTFGMTADEYYYNTDDNAFKKATSETDTEDAAIGNYCINTDKTLYIVTTAGTATKENTADAIYVSDTNCYVYDGSAWTQKSATKIYSLIRNSEGKIQTGEPASDPASWAAPVTNAYYTYCDKLYQYK